jgi:hypothetical protein
MAQSGNQTTNRRLRRQAAAAKNQGPNTPVTKATRKDRWTGLIIIVVVVAIISTVVGIFYYNGYVAPFHRTLISVGNNNISMGYFLKRAKLAGADPMSMIESITNEELVKIGAAQYGIPITAEDINRQLRIDAGSSTGGNVTDNVTDAEFREWYRQQLNESQLSDAEYREIIHASLASSLLQDYLAARVPTVAPQIHLHGIIANTLEDADKVRARLMGGEDFASVARDVFTDNASKETGGDLGWFPKGILPTGLDKPAFALNVGEVSESIPYSDPSSSDPSSGDTGSTQTVYFVFMVSEKADAREISADQLSTLQSQALQTWLTQARSTYDIKYIKFDSETYAWMNWQLAKGNTSSGTSSDSSGTSGQTSGGTGGQ